MAKGNLERLVSAWKASVGEVLDRLEDPAKMVRLTVRDMETSVERAVHAAAGATASLRRLEQQQERLRAEQARLQQQAETCLAQGDEAGARAALAQGTEVSLELEVVALGVEESRRAAGELRTQARELRLRLQEARAREGSVVARLQAGRPSQAPGGSGGEEELEPFLRFERLAEKARAHEADLARLEHKVDSAVAEAEVYEELDVQGRAARQARRLDVERRVEEELAALRRRLRSGVEE
ncbi:MAG: PspA/IM30 family protein [Candidatus Latescibacterota bacterium]